MHPWSSIEAKAEILFPDDPAFLNAISHSYSVACFLSTLTQPEISVLQQFPATLARLKKAIQSGVFPFDSDQIQVLTQRGLLGTDLIEVFYEDKTLSLKLNQKVVFHLLWTNKKLYVRT